MSRARSECAHFHRRSLGRRLTTLADNVANANTHRLKGHRNKVPTEILADTGVADVPFVQSTANEFLNTSNGGLNATGNTARFRHSRRCVVHMENGRTATC